MLRYSLHPQDVSAVSDTLDMGFGGIPEQVCPRCGGGFVPSRRGHIYCSTNCRKYVSNRRRRYPFGPGERRRERHSEHNESRNVLFDREMVTTLKAYALKEKLSFSAAVRELLEWAIEDHLECRN